MSPPGSIITFYSYKGGVGRSFALANVAWALASWGYKVLCIDWDLDAPGLAHYFNQSSISKGLVELVTASPRESWRGFLTPISGAKLQGRLHLISAGSTGPDYVDVAQGLDWVRLFEKEGLAENLDAWRLEWKQAYDFILLDSRTGVTDIGALCTAYMPDILVFLFTANHQSIDGCLEVVARAQETRSRIVGGPALHCVPVLSRFDGRTEYTAGQEWLAIIEPKMAQFYASWAVKGLAPRTILERLCIPYVAYWSFGEKLPVKEEETRAPDSIRSYLESLAALLAHRLDQSDLLADSAERYIEAAIRSSSFPVGSKVDVFLASTVDAQNLASEVLASLHKLGLSGVLVSMDELTDASGPWPEKVDRARHAIFVFGRQQPALLSSRMRKLATQALETEDNRMIIPVLSDSSVKVSVPALLERNRLVATDFPSHHDLALALREALFQQDEALAQSAEQPSTNLPPELQVAASHLVSENDRVREGAARALLRQGSETAVRLLIPLIFDPNPQIRNIAATAARANTALAHNELARRRRERPQADDWFPAMGILSELGLVTMNELVPLLQDPQPRTRTVAIDAITRKAGPAASDWLLPMVEDEIDEVAAAAASAIIKLGLEFDPEILDAGWSRLISRGSTFEDIQRVAAMLDTPELGPDLRRFLVGKVREGEGRDQALRYLTSGHRTKAEQALAELISDDDPAVRLAALQALGDSFPPPSLQPLAERLLDRDKRVRRRAAQLLARFSRTADAQQLQAVVGRIVQSLGENEEEDVRIPLLEVSGRANATEELLSFLRDPSPRIRAAAASGLGLRADPTSGNRLNSEIRQYLIGLLRDADASVRAAAIEALSRQADHEVMNNILELAVDPASEVRAAVARALAPWIDDEPISGTLAPLLDDGSPAVRLAAVEAFGRSKNKDSPKRITKLFSDPDSHVRMKAAEVVARLLGTHYNSLLSRDFDATSPWRDPAEPIDDRVLARATRTGAHMSEIRTSFEQLNDLLGGVLRLTWKQAET